MFFSFQSREQVTLADSESLVECTLDHFFLFAKNTLVQIYKESIMSFTSQELYKAFVSNNNFMTKAAAPDGFAESLLQVDSIIYQKTGITAPSDPMNAVPMLRNIANALLQWFTIGMQGNIEEFEYKRRKDLFEWAITTLNAIQNGDENIYDDAGNIVSAAKIPTPSFESNQRITMTL